MVPLSTRTRKIKKPEQMPSSVHQDRKPQAKKSTKQVYKKKEESSDEEGFFANNFSLSEDDDDYESLSDNERIKNSDAHSGRPFKPTVDIDDISSDQENYEESESKFIFFLGDKLKAIPPLDEKPSLAKVYGQISSTMPENLSSIKAFDESLQRLIQAFDNRNFSLYNIRKDGLFTIEDSIAYFLLWICKYQLKEKCYTDFTHIILTIYNELIKNEENRHHDLTHDLNMQVLISKEFQNKIENHLSSHQFTIEEVKKMTKPEFNNTLHELIDLICSLIYYSTK